MKQKQKGSSAERELISLFWEHGWAAIRAAGSGSQRHPSPDVLAANSIRTIAIEAKAEGTLTKYLSDADIQQLREFARLFGAEPWLAVRYDKMGWYFFNPEDLKKTPKGYAADILLAKAKGLSFSELIGD